jgi:hypothetical protein
MIKLSLTFILAIYSLQLYATCAPSRVDEAIVMYDTNISYSEVLGAEEAACKRGQKLIVLPAGLAKHKEIGKINSDLNYITTLYSKHCPNSSRCKEITSQHVDLSKKLLESKREIKQVENPKALFKELAKDDIKIKSIILSGHDGGGTFGGALGRLSKYEIMGAYNEAYQGKPELKNELSSVYLWGCYTATLSETKSWKNGIPSLRLVAGFHGTGPSIGKDATRDYLQDLLLKEQEIFEEEDEGELKKLLSGLKNINYTLAGIYLEACNEVEYYLSREKKSEQDGGGVGRSFARVDDISCDGKKFTEDYPKYEAIYQKYFSGETPLPENTSSGELRDIYNFTRANQSCIVQKHPYSPMNPDHIGLLLFYNGVKENFPDVFKETIAAAQMELETLPSELRDAIDHDLGFMGWLYQSSKNNVHKAFGKEDQLKDLQKSKKSFWLPTAHNLEKASRSDLIDNLSAMDKFLSHPSFDMENISKRVKNVVKIKKHMEKYLYELDSRCMNMLAWHERSEAPPRALCQ